MNETSTYIVHVYCMVSRQLGQILMYTIYAHLALMQGIALNSRYNLQLATH